ncbi:MAG TPA: hypothetical protein DCR97_02395 [Deltaproteobacteria bacterium]|nr:hypothetical protein [Deltaproteobacteria bacterium]
MAIFICIALLGLGFLFYEAPERGTEPQDAVIPNDKESLFIFVPGEKNDFDKKAVEVRRTLSERAKADYLFGELRKAKAIPASAKLQQLAFGEDGMLYLDVSRAILEQQLDARGEIRVVYALTNSFIASFREVNRVQFLVDGHPVHTLFGVVYTYAPLPFNNDLQEE